MKLTSWIRSWIRGHMKTAIVTAIALIAIGAGTAYKLSAGAEATHYVFAEARLGDIAATVTGTGQVSASSQTALIAQASGRIVSVSAVAGQELKKGELIAQIDATDAAYELESARIEYQDAITVDPNDLADAEDALAEARADAQNSYTSALATVAAFNADAAEALESLDGLFDGYLSSAQTGLSDMKRDYIERAEDAYIKADDAADEFMKDYRALSAEASESELETLLAHAYSAAGSVAQAAKYAQDAVVYMRDRENSTSKAVANEAYEIAHEVLASANSSVTALASAQSSIASGKRALRAAETDLNDLKDGADETEIREKQLAVRQKEDAYADHFIRMPYDGIVASVDAKAGDDASSGEAIATVITRAKTAEISLNEVDAAKVKAGQKATVTFDALEDAELTGEVVSVDLVGTVSQGVVSYGVTIAFETSDERVKVGMTANASIETARVENVIAVPTSALQARGPQTFIQIMDEGAEAPRLASVETGFANDETTEIVSGLEAGQRYVVRTIAASGAAGAATARQASSASIFGGGAMRASTGAVRGGPTGGNRVFIAP